MSNKMAKYLTIAIVLLLPSASIAGWEFIGKEEIQLLSNERNSALFIRKPREVGFVSKTEKNCHLYQNNNKNDGDIDSFNIGSLKINGKFIKVDARCVADEICFYIRTEEGTRYLLNLIEKGEEINVSDGYGVPETFNTKGLLDALDKRAN